MTESEDWPYIRTMLRSVARHLALSPESPRRFLVSVSGGLDSMVLLTMMRSLAKAYPIELAIFHMNFQLRGRASRLDEALVQSAGEEFKIPVHSFRVSIRGKTAIQEKARQERLKTLESFKDWELIEAHHADDQVETFFFRLFRGAGVHGLSAMKVKSLRNGTVLWRPLLEFTKAELRSYAIIHRITYREDQSNAEVDYDRNWIRHEILPHIEKRFPCLRRSVLGLTHELSSIDSIGEISSETICFEKGWRWEALKGLQTSRLHSWIHQRFRSDLKIFLSRRQITDLAEKIVSGKPFAFNAPKGLVLRGFSKSRTRSESQIVFVPKQG